MESVQRARLEKTRMLFLSRELFLDCLRYDIERYIERARRKRMKTHRRRTLVVRINGTSDLAWLALLMAREYPEIQFYDYTKHARAWERTLPNYHLTFSADGPHNFVECMRALEHGVNVAVVFHTRKGAPLPAMWHGYRVIDGDKHDLRFLDPKGVVVGLRAKGPAIGSTSPFVVLAA
jgi:hypothetical protein